MCSGKKGRETFSAFKMELQMFNLRSRWCKKTNTHQQLKILEANSPIVASYLVHRPWALQGLQFPAIFLLEPQCVGTVICGLTVLQVNLGAQQNKFVKVIGVVLSLFNDSSSLPHLLRSLLFSHHQPFQTSSCIWPRMFQ